MFDSEILLGISQCKGKQNFFGGGGILKRIHSADQTAQLCYYQILQRLSRYSFRHWQELGFLIVYVTSRLDFQKTKVMSWLAEHNFPYGLVSFGNGITKDLQRHKTEFLRYLVNDVSYLCFNSKFHQRKRLISKEFLFYCYCTRLLSQVTRTSLILNLIKPK